VPRLQAQGAGSRGQRGAARVSHVGRRVTSTPDSCRHAYAHGFYLTSQCAALINCVLLVALMAFRPHHIPPGAQPMRVETRRYALKHPAPCRILRCIPCRLPQSRSGSMTDAAVTHRTEKDTFAT
jgi:hypothetical protein